MRIPVNYFVIMEIDDELEVIAVFAGQSPEDAAMEQGGVLVDAGPYRSIEDANDALEQLAYEEEYEGE